MLLYECLELLRGQPLSSQQFGDLLSMLNTGAKQGWLALQQKCHLQLAHQGSHKILVRSRPGASLQSQQGR